MGHYHIRLSEEASNPCTVILPQVKYRYKCLPMGVSNSAKNFQETLNKMSHGFEFIQAQIDGLFINTKVDRSDHLEKLELALQELKEKCPK